MEQDNRAGRVIKFRAYDRDLRRKRPVTHWSNGDIRVQDKSTNGGTRLVIGEYDLMQFTGLHDKNGKEIYEGDIFRTKRLANEDLRDCLWEVVWGTNAVWAEQMYGWKARATTGDYQLDKSLQAQAAFVGIRTGRGHRRHLLEPGAAAIGVCPTAPPEATQERPTTQRHAASMANAPSGGTDAVACARTTSCNRTNGARRTDQSDGYCAKDVHEPLVAVPESA